MKNYYIVVFLALCLSGCGASNQNTARIKKINPGITQEMSQTNLYYAQLLQQQGNYQSAIIEYRKILDSSVSDLETQKARLGVAQCLLKLKKFASAISVLKPLSLSPKSDLDSQIIAIMGEAMLHLGQYKDAESVLEIALSKTKTFSTSGLAKYKSVSASSENSLKSINFASLLISPCSYNLLQTTNSAPLWIAPCSANLGYAYLKNNKPVEAFLLYQKAAILYEKQGNLTASQKAHHMAASLETLIKQYETQ
jgi:tetratricopeptide (TPR) repeat protein